ncbi:uncharacterized protein LOC124242261 isoform X2 [Equus quagga]|uniref:uncharacterized protein LOC124242261 isoform X2 n=1 Tax=Equus quagga TaxID=89248 RepID=UPI001EE17868|nr:uncharacterized protein LOC124242261 isoform X2 [Equus quagga]
MRNLRVAGRELTFACTSLAPAKTGLDGSPGDGDAGSPGRNRGSHPMGSHPPPTKVIKLIQVSGIRATGEPSQYAGHTSTLPEFLLFRKTGFYYWLREWGSHYGRRRTQIWNRGGQERTLWRWIGVGGGLLWEVRPVTEERETPTNLRDQLDQPWISTAGRPPAGSPTRHRASRVSIATLVTEACIKIVLKDHLPKGDTSCVAK